MPSTINGVGTMYLGKKNLKVYPGECQYCGRTVNLQDYETRLWICVLYIPLIPLEKKQILSYCTNCSRHYAPNQVQWTQIQESTINADAAALASNPDSVEGSLKLLGSLIGFRREAEAEELAKAMLARMGDNVDVLLNIGNWYDQTKRKNEADKLFQKALALQPDNLNIKRAVALGYIENQDPVKARNLLGAEPALTPQHDAYVYFQLAQAFQSQGQHETALTLLAEIQKLNPKLGKDAKFRAVVKASEQQVPSRASTLPKISLFSRKIFWIPTGVIACLAALLWLNNYLIEHRKVYVVNGFDLPMDVRIDGNAAIQINPRSHRVVNIGGGEHVAIATINKRVLPEDKFELPTAFLSGFTGGTYIVNAGRGALIFNTQVVYVADDVKNLNPRPKENPTEYFAGRSMYRLTGIDHAFEEPPKRIKMSGNKEFRQACGMVKEIAADFFVMQHYEGITDEESLAFAEAHLLSQPDNRPTLVAYRYRGLLSRKEERCQAFIKQGLAERPILMEWHRGYQDWARLVCTEDQVQAEYEKLLAADPTNASLLYLNGRIVANASDAMALYDRAIAADPKNSYPYREKATQLLLRGEADQALDIIDKAIPLAPDELELLQLKCKIFSLARKWGNIEDLLGRELNLNKGRNLNERIRRGFLECLVAEGRADLAEQRIQEYETKLRQENAAEEEIISDRMQLDYMLGRFDKLKEVATANRELSASGKMERIANLELGDLVAAEEGLGADPMDGKPYFHLALALAWAQQGKKVEASIARTAAVDIFKTGTRAEKCAAELLENLQNLKFEDTENLLLDPEQKALVLAALAEAGAPHKAKLLALADKLNFKRTFPYHVLDRTIKALKK